MSNISSSITNNNKFQRINHSHEHQTTCQQKPKPTSIWWQHSNHNVISEQATETEDSDCLSDRHGPTGSQFTHSKSAAYNHGQLKTAPNRYVTTNKSELETKTKRDRRIPSRMLSGTSGEEEEEDDDHIDYDDDEHEDDDDESTSLSHSDVNNYPRRNQQNAMQYSLPLPVLVPIPIITPLITRTYPTSVMMHSTTCCSTTRDQSSDMESVSSNQLVLGVKLPFSALDSQIRAKPPPSVRIPPPPPPAPPPQPIPPSSLYQHQSHQHHDKHRHLQHQPHLSSLSSISASSPSPQSPPPPPQRQHQQKSQLKSTKEERSSCSSPSMLSIHEVEIVANRYTDLKYSNHSNCTSPINSQRCVVQNLSKTYEQNTSNLTVTDNSMETKHYNNNPSVPTISNNATTSTTTTTTMTTSNTPLTELIIVNEVASRSVKPRVAFIEPADEASIHDSNPTTTTITTNNNNNQSDSESTVQINKENHPTTATNKLKLSLSARFPGWGVITDDDDDDDDDDVRGGGGDNQQNVKTAQNDNVSVSAETLICSTVQKLTSSNPNRNSENRIRQIINKKVNSHDFNVNTAHTPPATNNNINDMYSKTNSNSDEHNNIEERRHREDVDSEQEGDADEDDNEVMKPKASLYTNPEISLSQLMNMNDEELYYELHEKYQNKRQQPSTSQLLTSQKLNEHKQQQLQQPQRTSSILSQPRKSLAMIFSQISNNLGFTQESTTTGGGWRRDRSN
ncbi:unnamed protein product [Trichobilharzia szidati]|nr:unnamed protein product [Trichobilharzia szidati]